MAHITNSVEYGIHCLLWLVDVECGQPSSRDLAELQGISPSFVAKIFPKLEKAGIVQLSIGKVNFTDEQLMENFLAALGAILKAKPSGAKGRYIQGITVSASMGPGISIDTATASKLAG